MTILGIDQHNPHRYCYEQMKAQKDLIRRLINMFKKISYCEGGQGCWYGCRHEKMEKLIKEASAYLGEK